MKRLIVCNDGTWNSPSQEDNGIPAPTNVAKLYNAVAQADANGVQQVKYYHPGVGTGNWLDSIVGGAVGVGVSNQIKSAYHWLATNYADGDEIFVFGFSRGAFVARSLCGFLNRGLLKLQGLPHGEAWKRVEFVYNNGYRKYPSRQATPQNWVDASWAFFNAGAPAKVRFLGVWETVGALGIPDDLELLNLFDNKDAWAFHDTELSEHVSTARHAMAIDEIRASFTVSRWSNANAHPDAKELWFPGVHSDVGGGYSNTDLSDGALLWMMEEAEAANLRFRDGVNQTIKPDPLGVIHNSYKGSFAKLRSRPRAMDAMVPGNRAKFHPSALQRQTVSPISHPPYHPTRILVVDESCTVEIYADTFWNETGLYLERGHEYVFSATGEWLDSKDACTWKGTEDGKLTQGDIIRAAGTLLGKLETAAKKIIKNSSTDFLMTKRVEGIPWFRMTGAIANDAGEHAVVPNDGSPCPHQYIDLPAHETTPLKIVDPGYLYCFPNDVWSLYGNNHGSIKLTIKRVA